jgi:predicted Zn-ribbon and HTH transcriptional regulator
MIVMTFQVGSAEKQERKRGNKMAKMWGSCPICKSDNITYCDYEFGGEWVWQPASCDDCDYEWQAVWVFSHNETRSAEELDDDGNLKVEKQ